MQEYGHRACSRTTEKLLNWVLRSSMSLSSLCGVWNVLRFLVPLCERKRIFFSNARIDYRNFSAVWFSATEKRVLVKTTCNNSVARLLGQTSSARQETPRLRIHKLCSVENRLDCKSSNATSHHTLSFIMFKRKRGPHWWSLAMRVWPLRLLGGSLFELATSRKWNVRSPLSTWLSLVGSVHRTHR
jgi:hypothetical protein